MTTVAEFWQPHETTVNSFTELAQFIQSVGVSVTPPPPLNGIGQPNSQDVLIGWRGQVNADWPLVSSLYRQAEKRGNFFADRAEEQQRELEREYFRAAQAWGLQNTRTGRLSALELLAVLQHHGVPTRLIDVSLDAFTGAFFAVEQSEHDNQDGRLFAVDMGFKLINRVVPFNFWQESSNLPWPARNRPKAFGPPGDKTTEKQFREFTYGWIPAPADERISAQRGAFIFGGVPSDPNLSGVSCISFEPASTRSWGGQANKVYSARIPKAAKQEIRKALAAAGYNHARLFPDRAGFAKFGLSKAEAPFKMKTDPPGQQHTPGGLSLVLAEASRVLACLASALSDDQQK